MDITLYINIYTSLCQFNGMGVRPVMGDDGNVRYVDDSADDQGYASGHNPNPESSTRTEYSGDEDAGITRRGDGEVYQSGNHGKAEPIPKEKYAEIAESTKNVDPKVSLSYKNAAEKQPKPLPTDPNAGQLVKEIRQRDNALSSPATYNYVMSRSQQARATEFAVFYGDGGAARTGTQVTPKQPQNKPNSPYTPLGTIFENQAKMNQKSKYTPEKTKLQKTEAWLVSKSDMVKASIVTGDKKLAEKSRTYSNTRGMAIGAYTFFKPKVQQVNMVFGRGVGVVAMAGDVLIHHKDYTNAIYTGNNKMVMDRAENWQKRGKNFGRGVVKGYTYGIIHPIQTVKGTVTGTVQLVTHPVQTTRKVGAAFASAPIEMTGQVIGGYMFARPIYKAAGKAVNKIPGVQTAKHRIHRTADETITPKIEKVVMTSSTGDDIVMYHGLTIGNRPVVGFVPDKTRPIFGSPVVTQTLSKKVSLTGYAADTRVGGNIMVQVAKKQGWNPKHINQLKRSYRIQRGIEFANPAPLRKNIPSVKYLSSKGSKEVLTFVRKEKDKAMLYGSTTYDTFDPGSLPKGRGVPYKD
jgi:hypothetical protein